MANSAKVLVFGGGNTERILLPDDEIIIGRKFSVGSEDLFGGSGVNPSARFLAMGVPTLPLLNIGDDRSGKDIQSFIRKIALSATANKEILDHIESVDFFCRHTITANSIILVNAGARTIFKSKTSDGGIFSATLESRIDSILSKPGLDIAAVLIGHLPSPSAERFSGMDPTKLIIERFYGRCPIFVNLGQQQFSRGYGYWKDSLQKISYLQMNISEARDFFEFVVPSKHIPDILDFLAVEHITCNITLDMFGAICLDSSDSKNFIYSPEYILDERIIKDPTGAGDAFMAGVVFHFWKDSRFRKNLTHLDGNQLVDALNEGRKWAAFSCTKLGGASSPPNDVQLGHFLNLPQFIKVEPVVVYERPGNEQFLRILDKAVSRPLNFR